MLSKHRMFSLRHGCPFARSRRAVKPRSRPRRADGAGLDGEGTDRATLYPPPDGRLRILSAVSAIPSGREPSLKSTVDLNRL